MEGFKSYKKQIDEIKGGEGSGYRDNTYEDALIAVKKYIQEKKLKNNDVGSDEDTTSKEFFLRRKKRYKEYIRSAVSELRLRVDDYTKEDFISEALSDIAGFSVLDDAFEDPSITDIFVNAWDEIYFDDVNGEGGPYWRKFRSEQHYLETLERFLKEAGKEVNGGDKKIVHFSLYQNRGCVIHESVATKQTSLTFRKHSSSVKQVTRDDLIERGVLTAEMADFIGLCMRGEGKMAFGGITGSGKTTTCQALANEYLSRKRILVCEDTAELQMNVGNVLSLLSFKGKSKEETVELEDLIHTALRQKPRTILIGEIRTGPQLMAAIESGDTGHSTIYTIHGNSALSVVNRIVTKYLSAMPSLGPEVAERIIASSLDYIYIQDAIPDIGRKITSITEVGYDFENKRITLVPIYEYDVEKNEFVKLNKMGESKIKDMYRRGIKPWEVERWK